MTALIGIKTALSVSVLTIIPVPGRGHISSQRRVYQLHDSTDNGLASKKQQ
ncbi:hypothetical protein N9L68_03750 [bacterium]|nr:hypothetical protein [bacterium]